MRAGQAAFCRDLGRFMAVNVLNQLLFNLPGVRKRVGDRRNRFVYARELFLRRNVRIYLRCVREQLFAVIRTVADDLRADMRHAQRKIIPHGKQRGLFLAVTQDAGFVVVQTVVFLQIARVVGPQLAQGNIQEPPPRGRARPHQHQVFRAEQHGFQDALHVCLPPLAHAVLIDLHGLCARKAQFKREIAPLRRKIRLDKGMIRSEPKAFFFLRRAEQPHGRAGCGRLKQVGLALPVLPADQVDRRIQNKPFVLVVAELLKRECADIHRCTTLQDGFLLRNRSIIPCAPPWNASAGQTMLTPAPLRPR